MDAALFSFTPLHVISPTILALYTAVTNVNVILTAAVRVVHVIGAAAAIVIITAVTTRHVIYSGLVHH